MLHMFRIVSVNVLSAHPLGEGNFEYRLLILNCKGELWTYTFTRSPGSDTPLNGGTWTRILSDYPIVEHGI